MTFHGAYAECVLERPVLCNSCSNSTMLPKAKFLGPLLMSERGHVATPFLSSPRLLPYIQFPPPRCPLDITTLPALPAPLPMLIHRGFGWTLWVIVQLLSLTSLRVMRIIVLTFWCQIARQGHLHSSKETHTGKRITVPNPENPTGEPLIAIARIESMTTGRQVTVATAILTNSHLRRRRHRIEFYLTLNR